MRSVLLYLVLVGVPLLGLFGILEAGKRIVPPRSMGGEWVLTPAPAPRAPSPCLDFGAGPESVRLSVSQSGTRAEVTVGVRSHIRISAEVRGDSLIGWAPRSGLSTCPEAAVRLRAELRELEGRGFLRGTLDMDGCERCPPVPFGAKRLVGREAS